MYKNYAKLVTFTLFFFWLLMLSQSAFANFVRGIYITQSTLEDTPFINYLIARSKAVGINTFIVDMDRPSKQFAKNITLLKENNIHYVARVVIFPDGATPELMHSKTHWEKRYRLIEAAIHFGAEQIQLDYIRYNTKQPASPQNAKDVTKVIRWYKERVAAYHIPLQVDVFGISSFGEEQHIGQSIKMISETADVICPMVYPSHFEPFREHAVTPYKTIYESLTAIKEQFDNKPLPFKLKPYIEMSNYRYPLSKEKKLAYIRDQIKAVHDAGADGWYAWSALNKYDNLFRVLEGTETRAAE